MGDWQVIVEGANTYSPEPSRRAARLRMERSVYRERGVLIATDYLVNSGGVIYAAQEKLIRTPDHLRIPDEMLGNRAAVDQWLAKYQHEFSELAEVRRRAGEEYRQVIIQKNMIEFIDLLVSDSDMLPSEAAEKISVRRITRRESHKVAAEIMESMPAIDISQTIQDAALSIINSGCPILAVLLPQGELAGVLTEWDITQATAQGISKRDPAELIMSKEVISADPADSLLDVIRKLEYHEISAMPVVSKGIVKGMISSDLLARKSLLSLLQSQI
jgi:glutamate dehydrogenase (NAD(P)+)